MSEQFFIPFSSWFLCFIYNRANVILVQFWNYWLYCGKILLVQNVWESGRCRQQCFAITNCQFLLFALTAIAYSIFCNSPLIADSIYFPYLCDKTKKWTFTCCGTNAAEPKTLTRPLTLTISPRIAEIRDDLPTDHKQNMFNVTLKCDKGVTEVIK